ncbi:MAG TPA: SpoIID/LytB domain-containing protein [Thermodesulfobacteriota bacterium]|nr:SpoIID/LytB domain-containing protein [Thermodesulfobacteriota bacterium]
MTGRTLLITVAAFWLLFAAACQAGQGAKTIRVLVLKTDSLTVTGAGEPALEIKSGRNGAITVNGKSVFPPVRLAPAEEFLYMNGRPYRGASVVYAGPGGLSVVNELSLDDYIAGVINNEISSKWPEEAVKAQAVVARTYAVYRMNTRTDAPYDIEGTVMGQVYSGAASEDPEAIKAVRDTAGQILTFAGEPALTVYHSNAGGVTDSSEEIWAEYYPYLLSVDSPFDREAPRYVWEFALPALSLKALLSVAGYDVGEVRGIKCDSFTPAGRVKSLVISGSSGKSVRMRGEDLRKIIGYSYLRSSLFSVEKKGDLFVFTGRGSGHGVGMSQWGAKGMAEKGFSYAEVLRHFYKGTVIQKLY